MPAPSTRLGARWGAGAIDIFGNFAHGYHKWTGARRPGVLVARRAVAQPTVRLGGVLFNLTI